MFAMGIQTRLNRSNCQSNCQIPCLTCECITIDNEQLTTNQGSRSSLGQIVTHMFTSASRVVFKNAGNLTKELRRRLFKAFARPNKRVVLYISSEASEEWVSTARSINRGRHKVKAMIDSKVAMKTKITRESSTLYAILMKAASPCKPSPSARISIILTRLNQSSANVLGMNKT
ncbi:hypothetical protein BX666DRAFT_659774 [Dichotomocladium elegans]|nr:hypothetical protein BX666DRAFT_659774 [Dichotomocladium elegans]